VDTLEYISDNDKVISEISEVLKEKGKLVLTTPYTYEKEYVVHRDNLGLRFKRDGRLFKLVKTHSPHFLLHILKKHGIRNQLLCYPFKLFAKLAWEIHYLMNFHFLLFPFLYHVARLDFLFDGRRASNDLRGDVIIVGKKQNCPQTP
jgi:SAM-dependent methyltransferase